MRPLFFLPNYTLGSLGPSRFRTPGDMAQPWEDLKSTPGILKWT